MDDSLSHTIAGILSTITIVSSLYLKIPQIMHIQVKKSSKGIYTRAMLMEITGYSIMMLYNYTNEYNLMTYLEYPIIIVQVYVMLYYVLKYDNKLQLPIVPLGAVIYVAVIFGFVAGYINKNLLTCLVPFCTPLSGVAKITYIYGIINANNADAVSLLTWVISIGTNLSRLFTIFVESADVYLMANFSISAVLSAGVLVTAIYYKSYPGHEGSCLRESSCRLMTHIYTQQQIHEMNEELQDRYEKSKLN